MDYETVVLNCIAALHTFSHTVYSFIPIDIPVLIFLPIPIHLSFSVPVNILVSTLITIHTLIPISTPTPTHRVTHMTDF
jgi:hypothetical protein